jgi:HNH endonuclease
MAGRLTREHIWSYHMGLNMKGKCLCCEETEITYNAIKGDASYWHRGHIIHKRHAGPDIYENIRPICVQCNKADKNFETSYHYMVIIRPQLKLDVYGEINRIKYLAWYYLENPSILKCVKCGNNKMPKSEYCGNHDKSKSGILAIEQQDKIDLKELEDTSDRDNKITDPDFINDGKLDYIENSSNQNSETSEDDGSTEIDKPSKSAVTKKIITTRSKSSKSKKAERARVAATSDQILTPKKNIRDVRELVASFKRSLGSLTANQKSQLDVIIEKLDQIENPSK